MKTRRPLITRGIASLAVAALMGAAVAPITHADIGNGSATTEDSAARQQQMRERMQVRLDSMAKRLQIDARQQEAWNEYAKTVQSMLDTKAQRPQTDADAATIIRYRANLASTHAQKLTQVADATAKLQEVLTPEQRKALTEMVRHEGRSPDERHMRHRGDQPRQP